VNQQLPGAHATKMLEEADRVKTDFVANMSYELRTPLTSIGGFAELLGGLELAFGRHDLRAAFTLGLGFFCHCALHIVGKYNVFNLDRGHLCAPRLRVPVDDVLDLQVDARGVGEKLIEAESSNHIAHGGLADLIDRIVDVLNRDHRLFRIGNVIVRDRRDVDRDIVLGDYLLRRDLHRNRAEGHAHHLLDRKEDERKSRSAAAIA